MQNVQEALLRHPVQWTWWHTTGEDGEEADEIEESHPSLLEYYVQRMRSVQARANVGAPRVTEFISAPDTNLTRHVVCGQRALAMDVLRDFSFDLYADSKV